MAKEKKVPQKPKDTEGHDTITLGIGGEGKKEIKVIDAGDKKKGDK